MATVTDAEPAPAPVSDRRLVRLTKRLDELRDCQARYADFTLGLFDQFERLGSALLAKESALDVNRLQADEHHRLAERHVLEAQRAYAELELLQTRLCDVETELQRTRSELEQERQCTASEKVSLDEETREFLDDLVQERDALRTRLASLQALSEDQKAGYESEIELLRHQLHDTSQQVIMLREKLAHNASAAQASASTSAEFRGDVSRRAEDFQAPCDTAETSPTLTRPPVKMASGAAELESLMNQVRLLQQDVARRRGQREGR